MKKTIFLGSSIFLGVTPILTTISCSNSPQEQPIPPIIGEEENDNTKPQIPEINDDLTLPKIEIQWLQGYRDEKSKFINSDNFYLDIEESILANNQFHVWYVGKNKNDHCFNIYDQEINKFYLLSLTCNYDLLFTKFSRTKAKNYIGESIIKDYEEKMIINHSISDDDFFVPLDYSDKSLEFIKNNQISIQSSWGVANHGSAEIIFNLNTNLSKVREMLFGPFEKNFNNFVINNIKVSDLFILPRSIIMNHPINYLNYQIRSIRDNETNIYLDLSKDEKGKINLDLAGKGGKPSQYWSTSVGNKKLSGDIVPTNFIGGLANSILAMIDSNNKNYGDIINKINKSNQYRVKTFIDEIVSLGKRINVSKKFEKINNKEIDFSFNINSIIDAEANASHIFGDWTEVSLYNIDSLVKMNVEFKEYKKF